MANIRSGAFGEYYGSSFNESQPLTEDEKKVNAIYIYTALKREGWSLNGISALLGNVEAESSINPGRWQNDNVGNYNSGYGLVQWTPASNYIDWCSTQNNIDPSIMDANLSRILYELANGLQWIPTSAFPLTFKEFSVSNESVRDLAASFLLNYERPADQSEAVQSFRGSLAEKWYSYLSGEPLPDIPDNPDIPDTPTGSTKKRTTYNFILFNRRRRTNQWIKRHF